MRLFPIQELLFDEFWVFEQTLCFGGLERFGDFIRLGFARCRFLGVVLSREN
jgi:hypothetical protein